MFPKEHGAWNALLVSLIAGWVVLHEWNLSAMAASLLWLSGFILRAPLGTFRQYQRADRMKARKALFFFSFLLLVFTFSGMLFWEKAPPAAFWLVLEAGLPLGLWISGWAVWKRNMRFLWVEVPGFAGLCLLGPVLYLTGPSTDEKKAILFYLLFGGYFILSLFYVKVRQKWVAQIRTRKTLSREERAWDGRWIILAQVVFFILVAMLARPAFGVCFGPLYALVRVWVGLKWGRADLPIMKLGIREMAHSGVYTFISLFAWETF